MFSVAQKQLDIGFRSYASDVQAHTHAFYQIVLPSRGVLEMDIDGRLGRVDSNCAAVIGAGARHAFCAADKNRFLVLDIQASEHHSSARGDKLGKLSEKRYVTLSAADHHLLGYAEQMLTAYTLTTRSTQSSIPLMSHWLELLLESLGQELQPTHNSPGRALARATAFIGRSYHHSIGMADICSAAGLGASRLYELFQQHLGMTPREHVAKVRLQQALALLSTTELSIAEIALRTGHADQSTLTRHMRRACGITPAAYRRAREARTAASGETAKDTGDRSKNR